MQPVKKAFAAQEELNKEKKEQKMVRRVQRVQREQVRQQEQIRRGQSRGMSI
jgi:hypothetical protein